MRWYIVSCIFQQKREQKACPNLVFLAILRRNLVIILQFRGKQEMIGLTFYTMPPFPSVTLLHIFHLKMTRYTGSCSALVQHTKRSISHYTIVLQGGIIP